MSEADTDGFVELDVANPADVKIPQTIEETRPEPERDEAEGKEPDEKPEAEPDEEDDEDKLRRRRQRRQKRAVKKGKSEAALLAEQVRTLMAEVKSLHQGQRQTDEQTIAQVVQRADADIIGAENFYREAHTRGGPDDKLRAEKTLQDARFRRWQLEQQIEARRQEPAEQETDTTPELNGWLQENSDWFGKDPIDTARAAVVDKGLTAEWNAKGLGHLRGRAQYLAELDDRLARELPHRYEDQAQEPKRNRPRQTVIGSGRQAGDGDRVRMPRVEYDRLIENARKAGLDPTKKDVHDGLVKNWYQRQKDNE